MFAVYAETPSLENPLSGLVVGELPDCHVPTGWVRVKISHASLNRHDIFTLMGVTVQPQPIPFPMILGNDGAGTLDDGTEVVIYPVIGDASWRGDDVLDPTWHILTELVPGTMADYIAVPRRNVIPRPKGLSALHAAVLGTAWLTAYRALFTQSGLRAGETLLVQGASGGMSTALIQLGRAAGIEVWVTTRSREGREVAERLGASRVFSSGDKLPRRVDAVIDNVGVATWEHTIQSVRRGGTVVINGITTGAGALTDLLRVFVESLTIKGTVAGTLDEMNRLIRFVVDARIEPEISQVVPMEQAAEGLRAMWEGRAGGKIVCTRGSASRRRGRVRSSGRRGVAAQAAATLQVQDGVISGV